MPVILRKKKTVLECDAGGVSAPMSTVNNVGGVGNAVPAQIAAMTATEQSSPVAIGSGDLFGAAASVSTQASYSKKRNHKKLRFKKNHKS